MEFYLSVFFYAPMSCCVAETSGKGVPADLIITIG